MKKLQCKVEMAYGIKCVTRCVALAFSERECRATVEQAKDDVFQAYFDAYGRLYDDKLTDALEELVDERVLPYLQSYIYRVEEQRKEQEREHARQVRRLTGVDLVSLDANDRKCDHCGQRAGSHSWIELDPIGFAVDCSNDQGRAK